MQQEQGGFSLLAKRLWCLHTTMMHEYSRYNGQSRFVRKGSDPCFVGENSTIESMCRVTLVEAMDSSHDNPSIEPWQGVPTLQSGRGERMGRFGPFFLARG